MRTLPLLHLARRFVDFVGARPLTPSEQEEIARFLRADERIAFYAQVPADQRHGYETMRRAAAGGGTDPVLRAALLHDVGKAQARLGAIRRSVATLVDGLRLPLWASAATYRRHGEIGGETLARLGAEPLVVDFARRHPDPDPGDNDPRQWRILLDADDI